VVGNCSPIKNHTVLLRALARQASRDWLLLHAGEEAPERDERTLTASLGIADRVRFVGVVSDMTPLLHASDCFVMPSLREGLSIALLEALGVGLPALLADTPGLIDLQPLFADLRFAAPDESSFARALGDLLARPRAPQPLLRHRTHDIAQRHFGV